ncbi:zinc finger CW-type PWWP domain protein 1 [Elgaria multicarinata webbii]|uniref:zinc finger CW-type PWWP domain protein 1 n=1 Tax=Elgaria multicarinata webbii TaxID=159646 RepID=UPI002FCD5EDE
MKMFKRMFAPPVAKPQHTSFVKGEAELQGKQEDIKTKGVPAPLSHAAGDGVATKPIKAPKARPNRQKGNISRKEKERNCKEDPEMTKDEEGCLTDAQFEEIVQSVLQKTLQECMGWCMAWVQCSYPTCEKWRRLSSDTDPSILPEDWSCSQNTDLQYNSCNISEETWLGSENEVVYAVYIPGSIVWAKQYGYPWWPGIVEADPDIGEYFLFSCQTDSFPSKYHVTFFGKTVTRAWISASMLRNFDEPNVEGNGLTKFKNKGDKKNLEAALKMAEEAEQRSIQERIRVFGFLSRFSGRESPRDHKDIKDPVSITCKPHVKRIQGPRSGNKNTAAPNKSRGKLLPGTAVMKLDGDVEERLNGEGGRKSKLVPEAASSLSKKSRRELQAPKAATVPKGSGKTKRHQNDQNGFKKSFSVPQCKNTKAEHYSSCANSSTSNIVLSSYASKKGSLKQAKTSPMAESKLMLSKDIMNLEESNGAAAVGKDEEEIFSSQEMAVFAEEKNYSPENFSLVLFEE